MSTRARGKDADEAKETDDKKTPATKKAATGGKKKKTAARSPTKGAAEKSKKAAAKKLAERLDAKKAEKRAKQARKRADAAAGPIDKSSSSGAPIGEARIRKGQRAAQRAAVARTGAAGRRNQARRDKRS